VDACTASDAEAADLLSGARLDDDGRAVPQQPATVQPGRRVPDHDRAARAADPLLPLMTPAEGSGGQAAGGSVGRHPSPARERKRHA
jgi:hypothetical protein